MDIGDAAVATRKTPSISVVIPIYNRTQFLPAAIASIRAQTIADKPEIIVVDDGSSQDVAGSVSSCGEDIRFIRQDNAGVCAARNRGARSARADIIAFLDDDDIARPRLFEHYKRIFREHPDIDVVFADFSTFTTGEPPLPGHRLLARHKSLLDRLPHSVLESPGNTYRLPAGCCLPFFVLGTPMAPSAMAVRADAFEGLGGWDESIAFECHEFSIRAAFYKHCAFIDEDLMALRRGHSAHATHNEQEYLYQEALVLARALRRYPPDLRRCARPLVGVHCFRLGRRLTEWKLWKRGLRLTTLGLRLAKLRLLPQIARAVWRRTKRLLGRRGQATA